MPEAVYVDFDVIRAAPPALNRTGVGDILCYHTAHFDWRLAHEHGREEPRWPYDQRLVAAARERLDAVLGALDDIRDVTEEGIRTLMHAHRWGGATFHDSGWNPRHIEGVDHFLFYNLERMTGRHFIHGQPVGLGIVVGSLLQDNEPGGDARGAPPGRRRHPPRGDGRDWDEVAGRRCGRWPPYVREAGLWFTVADVATGRRPRCAARVRERVEGTYGPWEESTVKLGLTLPQGCDREYLGLDAGDRLAAHGRDRPAGGGGRVRVALGVRPLPGRPAARGGAHLRAVRRAGGARAWRPAGPGSGTWSWPRPTATRA